MTPRRLALMLVLMLAVLTPGVADRHHPDRRARWGRLCVRFGPT